MTPCLSLLLIVVMGVVSCDASISSTVTVQISAPWRSTPVLEQAAFYAALSSTSSLFWDFVRGNKSSSVDNAMSKDKLLMLSIQAGEFVATVEAQTRLSTNLKQALGFTAQCNDDAWAAVETAHGSVLATCDGKDLLERTTDECASTEAARLELVPTDYIHPSSAADNDETRTMVIHGDLASEGFHRLWDAALAVIMKNKGFRLVLRMQAPLQNTVSSRFGGFSASMDIKNTEYVAVDRSAVKKDVTTQRNNDDQQLESGVYFSTLSDRFKSNPEKQAKLATLKADMQKNRQKLKAWEVADVSIQTAMDALGASDPLGQLKEVTENMPSHARRLAKIDVDDTMRELVASKPAFQTQVWLNGLALALGDDFGATLKEIRQDIHLSQLAQDTGIAKKQFMSWLASTAGSASGSWGVRIDVRKFAKGAVNFINDIEKDEAYRSMPKSLTPLRNSKNQQQQQLISVRRNLYTCILVLDPAKQVDIEPIAVLRYFVRVGAPIRFGIVLTSNQLAGKYGMETSKDIPMDNVLPCSDKPGEERCMSTTCLVRLYAATRKEYGAEASLTLLTDLAQKLDPEGASCPEVVQAYAEILAQETGAWTNSKFVRFAEKTLLGEDGADDAVRKMARYAGALGLQVPSMTFNGQIHELTGGARFDRIIQPLLFHEQNLLSQQSASLVDEEDILSQILRLSRATARNSRLVNVPPNQMDFLPLTKSFVAANGKLAYVISSVKDDTKPMTTLWIPLTKDSQCATALSALEILKEKKVRVAFLSTKKSLPVNAADLEKLFTACEPTLLHAQSSSALPTLPAGTIAVCNGRVVTKVGDESMLTVQNLAALIDNEAARVGSAALSSATLTDDDLMVLSSVLGLFAKKPSSSMDSLPELSKNDDLTIFPKEEEDWSRPDIVLTIDPLSLDTPKACAFAHWMRAEFSARITLAFSPRADIAQLPPSSFHRWTPDGMRGAVFANLPQDQLLTLKLATPQSWIVYPSDMGGNRDPDNVIMSEGSFTAIYQIAHVLIDGHAGNVDQGGEPAAGMQIELLEFTGLPSQTSARRIADSIVMYNLGYWQMKARPGIWRVRPLRGFALATKGQDEKIVAYTDYSGPGSIELRVHKQEVQVNDGRQKEEEGDDTMHVFSLASGALYERFLRIMMLSVRKRSSGKIKFWLLENYMSSPMKEFLPGFAEKNGFSYELVTFKWPDWLRGQNERQRQIWGMKILFLDVLFPLSVKRIIYVDSDQVLRADLRELWNMDLKGAPYAMTPFCDSRKETLGFQFWRQGYWASHLRGKHYHISALFVVDLVTFRRDSVGDRLRAVYQQLSADPNSLSNLDQDLPNFAQHDIRIYSLPQEWLWCESWCSDSSKVQAKTIDLCNNPLHKEPKLEMAKRVIRGELFKESWEELDAEVGWIG